MSTTLHRPLQLLQKVRPAATGTLRAESAPIVCVSAAAGWMERLARWAERQPPHHRLGSFGANRHL